MTANKAKVFLQRNIDSCTEKMKEACYKSMVGPILEYVSTVWSQFTKKNIIAKIESVQRQTVRFVTSQ